MNACDRPTSIRSLPYLVLALLLVGLLPAYAEDAGRAAQIEQSFRQRDKNGDGVLSAEEVGNPEMFKRLDANGDGQVTLAEAQAFFAAQGNQPPTPPPPVGPDQSFTPLTDLGANQYQGFPGGLYPNGANTPPAAYLQQGLAAARTVQPLSPTGDPSPTGAVVLLSIGMSNTTMEFSAFQRLANADPAKNPSLIIVDGAQGGQDATKIKDPAAPFWTTVDQRLTAAGVTAAQVQVAWIKEAIAGESRTFPADAQELQDDLAAILQIMETRYPHLRLVYVSSRIYAGYATTRLNPEPVAYQGGFAVKWFVEDRIKQPTPGPWVAWGPYLWTDGVRGRADGLVWNREDCGPDGTHPSPRGCAQVADLLLKFFQTDETARGWFVK
ncbi:MAG TPA: hypothetical protein VGM19_01460 [Armatimonadota bacterium]|jgi:hypothetical protein